MNFRCIIFFIILFLNACEGKKESIFFHLEKNDSISRYFYKIASNKKISLKKRQKAIDSSYKLLFQSKKDTFLHKVLYKKSYLHYLNEEYDSLLYYSNILYKELQFNDSSSYKGKISFLKGFYYANIAFKPDSALYYYNQSKNIYQKTLDTIRTSKSLLNMSYVQLGNSDYFGSKETSTQALNLLELSNENSEYLSIAYDVLATSNRKLLNHKDAILYFKKAIEKATSKDDKLLFKNNLATTYIDIKRFNKAIIILKEIVQDVNKQKYPMAYARALDNLAYLQWLKDSKNVKSVFVKALNIRETNNDKVGLMASYTHLGEFYMIKNKTEAIDYFNKAIEISKTIKKTKNRIRCLTVFNEN